MTHRQAYIPGDLEVYGEESGTYTVRTACGQMVPERRIVDEAHMPDCPDCQEAIELGRNVDVGEDR